MILSGRWVVPVSSPPLDHGAIVVEDSRILEVGSLETVRRNHPGHALKSFPQAALLPGLVNVHTHLELTALRGYLEGLDFWQWIRALTHAKYEILNDDDILVSALLGAIEALRSGVTTLADPMDIGASLDAVLATGLRAVLYSLHEVSARRARRRGALNPCRATLLRPTPAARAIRRARACRPRRERGSRLDCPPSRSSCAPTRR